MTHSIIDLKRYKKALGYGDHKAIKERLEEKGIIVSASAITQVINKVYYNQDILDMAKTILDEKDKSKN